MWKSILKIFLFVVFVANDITTAGIPGAVRVINGNRVSPSDFPYVLRFWIPKDGYFIIGTGSLISDKCAITALHVVKDAPQIKVCGGKDTDSEGICGHAKQYMFMPDIDLAVVVLQDPLKGDNIRPVEMDFNKVEANQWVQYVGYGKSRNGNDDPNKKYLNLANFQVESDDVCDGPYLMCYKDRSNFQDTQGGDSGGPVIHNGKQVGVLTGSRWSANFRNDFGPRFSNDRIKSFIQSEFARNC